MKLNLKLYSPLLFLLSAVILFSCKNKPDAKTALPVYNQNVYRAQALFNKANNYYNTYVYDSAFKYYIEVRGVYIKEKDYFRAGYTSYMMAEIQSKCGEYQDSQATAVEALDYFKKSGKTDYIDSVHDVIGITNRKLLLYDDAITNYKNARNYIEKPIGAAILDNNIAAVYIDKQEFSRAIALLEKLLKSKTVNNDSTTKARVLNNLGTAYFKQKNKKAVNYYIEALKIREALKNPVDLIASCLKLSDYYKDKNKDTFKAYAKRAYALASKINNREQKLSALSTLIDVTTGPEFEIYSKAYKVETEINNAIKASVKKEFAAMKYNYKNIEAQAAQNELKAQKDKLFLSILAMLAGLVFIISVFVNITQRGKHKKAKMEEAYKAESRISKKIHDELANEVFETLMFTDALQIDNLENKEILLKRLDKVYEKTRDISRENNSIDTSHNFYTLLIEMLARYKTEEINVLAVNTEVIAWDALDDHKKNTIYRVVQEFMVNMKKHSQATLVVVKFETDNKKLHISYVDNGVGITKNSFFHKNGLENAESRIKSINGTFTFDGVTKGVRISIIIPL